VRVCDTRPVNLNPAIVGAVICCADA